MEASVPLPADINMMTEAMPITTPRIVRKLRNLWVMTEVQAVFKGSKSLFILFPL
jgi:hypothetical protein